MNYSIELPPSRPIIRIHLPFEGKDQAGNTVTQTAPLTAGYLADWLRVGKSRTEVADMLRAIPDIESRDIEDELDRAWSRFISDAREAIADREDLEESIRFRDFHERSISDERRVECELPIEVEEEKLPKFPVFSGPLHDLVTAICPDLPYEFKVMAAVTYFGLIRSGMDSLAGEPNYQSRFFTCLIADPKRGKSASITEVNRWIGALKPASMLVSSSVNSGESLVDEFADLKKAWPALDRWRVLLDVDEMKGLFEKARTTIQSRNTLSNELLTLFESNRTGNRARHSNKGQRIQIDHAHLAILGGATEEGYSQMWTGTGGSATGLQSRFVPITTENGPLPINRQPSDTKGIEAAILKLQAIVEKPGQVISLTREAKEALSDWWETYSPWDEPSISRVDDFVKRLLLVLAVTNGVTVVGNKLVEQTTAFGDYVVAVRRKFNPQDSYSWTQAFENAIVAVFKKYSDHALTMNDVRRFIRPDRKPGGYQTFLQAWKTVIQADLLHQDGLNRKGVVRYRLAQ